MPIQHISTRQTLVATACVLSALATGCSTVSSALSNDKVDYKATGAKAVNLEVPPDLTQLSGQARYTLASPGTVSANTFAQQQNQGPSTAAAPAVAPGTIGGVTLQRDGQTRWLTVDQPPEQIYNVIREFWGENGFELTTDQPQTGLMETTWSENRAKLQQDGLRNLVGKIIDNLYDTGERDQYRTRIERTAKGSEVYIGHHGLIEVYTDGRKEQTTWRARPSDPALEAEMLSRLMVKLGTPKETAKATLAADQSAASASTAPRSNLTADGLGVAFSGNFDQAWRRVGLALDRGGFTVEDRDRSAGVFEVRLASTKVENKPGLLSRMTGWFSSKPEADTLTRYRLKVVSQGNSASVTVLGSDGKAINTDGAKDVAKQLATNLE